MRKKIAFTLAEVLITLAIIGVVSALVIPSVLKNYNDKKYNTARLKALKTFGEAGKMASINGEINGQENARAFVENVLSKYLKITKVCDTAEECGFPNKIQPSNPSAIKIEMDNIKSWKNLNTNILSLDDRTDIENPNLSIYIETAEGNSAKLFYNPKCAKNTCEISKGNSWNLKECDYYAVDATCLNVVYDMNKLKSPNHVGEDIGIVTIYWSGTGSVSVAPGFIKFEENKKISNMPMTNPEAQELCITLGKNKIYTYLPNFNELASMFINKQLSSMSNLNYWVSWSPISGSSVWYRGVGKFTIRSSYSLYTWCVRR